MRRQPRYPIYIPSKRRSHVMDTAKMFDRSETPYRVVVEPQDADDYAKVVGRERMVLLPENDRGLVFARNFIKQHAVGEGHARHWQFDDDIMKMTKVHKLTRLPVSANVALCVLEDFCDRYENVALASFNSEFFIPMAGAYSKAWPPFFLNSRCYTCFLMMNSLPNTWRHRYNEDTDMTLQVLADGWCTVMFNAFMIRTKATMTTSGGQTDIYVNDGRLRMARQLERVWPYVVKTTRKFNRPQHRVHSSWTKFDTQLIRRKDIDWDALKQGGADNYGLKLTAVKEIKSAELAELVKQDAT